jgi:predicted dehydrogenase
MARMFSKQSPISVYAEEFNPQGSWYKGDVAANCLFEMTGGVRFAYRGSWCAEGFPTSWNGDWRIISTTGTLLYSNDKINAEIITSNEGFQRPRQPLEIPPSEIIGQGQLGALREMLRYLRTGTKPQCECHDNIHSLAMVLAAIESSRTGQRVKIHI